MCRIFRLSDHSSLWLLHSLQLLRIFLEVEALKWVGSTAETTVVLNIADAFYCVSFGDTAYSLLLETTSNYRLVFAITLSEGTSAGTYYSFHF